MILGLDEKSLSNRISRFVRRHRWIALWRVVFALAALGITIRAGFGYVEARHELAAYKKWPLCTGNQQSKCLVLGVATVESMTPSARGKLDATVDLTLQNGTDDEVDFGWTSETRLFRVLHVGAQVTIRFPPNGEIDSITYKNVKADTTAAPGSQAGPAQLVTVGFGSLTAVFGWWAWWARRGREARKPGRRGALRGFLGKR
jgi:hypothetical protein